MKQLIFVPLEFIEERYSAQWYVWFQNEFAKQDLQVITVLPEQHESTIQHGQFLDVIKTNQFKAEQLQMICDLFAQNIIDEDTTFLFMDAWFPGLEMLAYLRDALKIRFKIVGLLHAGTWDQHDYLSQCGMEWWAGPLEISWLRILDAVCVATQFHKFLIHQKRVLHKKDESINKIHVTGFPIFPDSIPTTLNIFELDKKKLIVFPHRMAMEKNPQRFKMMMESDVRAYPELKQFSGFCTKEYIDWIDCSYFGEKDKKKVYYGLLRNSTFAVSFADQETFGIAMLESVLCGCYPIVPDRLSYSELYPECFKFKSTGTNEEINHALQLMVGIINNQEFYQQQLAGLQQRVLALGTNAIPNILNVCRGDYE